MNAVGAIRQIILNDAATVALLADATSVYPTVVPQAKTFPAVTLRIIDAKPNDSKSQVSPIDNVQIVCSSFGKTYNETQKIDAAIRTAIDGWSGDVTTTADSVTHHIADVRYLMPKDDFDEENILFVRTTSYDVRYYRTAPTPGFGNEFYAWLLALPEYDSDESAVAAGLVTSDVYMCSADHKSFSGGLPKQVRL